MEVMSMKPAPLAVREPPKLGFCRTSERFRNCWGLKRVGCQILESRQSFSACFLDEERPDRGEGSSSMAVHAPTWIQNARVCFYRALPPDMLNVREWSYLV